MSDASKPTPTTVLYPSQVDVTKLVLSQSADGDDAGVYEVSYEGTPLTLCFRNVTLPFKPTGGITNHGKVWGQCTWAVPKKQEIAIRGMEAFILDLLRKACKEANPIHTLKDAYRQDGSVIRDAEGNMREPTMRASVFEVISEKSFVPFKFNRGRNASTLVFSKQALKALNLVDAAATVNVFVRFSAVKVGTGTGPDASSELKLQLSQVDLVKQGASLQQYMLPLPSDDSDEDAPVPLAQAKRPRAQEGQE